MGVVVLGFGGFRGLGILGVLGLGGFGFRGTGAPKSVLEGLVECLDWLRGVWGFGFREIRDLQGIQGRICYICGIRTVSILQPLLQHPILANNKAPTVCEALYLGIL